MCLTNQSKGKAYFIGVQKGVDDIPDFKLYNVMCPGHPLNGSTIDAKQAREEGFELVEARYFRTMEGDHGRAFQILEEEAGL